MSKKAKKQKKVDPQKWVKFKSFSEDGKTFVIISAGKWELINVEEASASEVFILKEK